MDLNFESALPRIEFPELFFGLVAPIGADIDATLAAFKAHFSRRDYNVVDIKVTELFQVLKDYVPPNEPLDRSQPLARYKTYIAYGNQLREKFGDAALAATVINRIVRRRLRVQPKEVDRFQKTVFLLHQFKRKEEIDLLRTVYERLFFQISIYSRRGARVNELSKTFAARRNFNTSINPRAAAEEIVQIDAHEEDEPHGQRVGKIFHDADFIVSLDTDRATVEQQVERFCELLFGSNKISPTALEYGMFCAKAAALGTLDLSRQVGAAIFDADGQIISMGCNEVPKAGGGTYRCEDPFDDREYARGCDSNDEQKRTNLAQIAALLGIERPVDELLDDPLIRDSQLMDSLEYGRIVHAEMSAISNAARLGRQLDGSELYCTTFPCHMCAKHVVASGIKKVVFLEPYPKSMAADLHADSIWVEGSDRGKFQNFRAVEFQHFFGVTPRRFRELFERGKRKSDKGEFLAYNGEKGTPRPIVEIRFPFYFELEGAIIKKSAQVLVEAVVRFDGQP